MIRCSEVSHHLQQRQVSGPHVVKVDLDLGPVVERGVVECLALGLVVDEGGLVDVAGAVDAAAELAGEQVDAHDAEDEPEDETDQQHVHDGGNRPDQSVHHHLHRHTQHAVTHTTLMVTVNIQVKTEYIYSSTVLKYKSEVLALYLSTSLLSTSTTLTFIWQQHCYVTPRKKVSCGRWLFIYLH